MLIKDSVTTAPDESRHHLVRKTKARSEIDQVRMNQRTIVPTACIARGGDKAPTVGGRKVRGLVIPIHQWSEKFVPQTVSKGEFRSRLPSVHGIEGVSGLKIMNDVGCREKYDIRVSQQQIGKADIEATGDNSVLDHQTLRGFYVEEIVGPPEVLITELETMTAFQPVQVLNEVPRLRNLILRPPRRRPYCRETAEEYRGYAGV